MSRLRGLCGNGICWDGHWCSGEERVLRFCLEESVVSSWRHCILRPWAERGRLRDWVGRPLRPCASLGYGPWAGLWGYVSRPLRPSIYLGCGLWAEGGGLLSQNWRWSWLEAHLSYGYCWLESRAGRLSCSRALCGPCICEIGGVALVFGREPLFNLRRL